MSKINEFAQQYESKTTKNICEECGKELKYGGFRCRQCYNIYFKEYSSFAKGFSGKSNGMWKGDHVSYSGLHKWIRKYKSKPKYCEICNVNPPLQVANISGKYIRNINDYQWLCVKCHVVKDGTINNLIYNKNKTEVKIT